MAKRGNKTELLSTNATIADNRKARYEYFLEEKFEAGIALTGTEVKSLRHGQCSLNEAFAAEKGGELWLLNFYIAPYNPAGAHLQHEPRRPRRLMLHKKQIQKLLGSVTREGYTLIPTRIYFNGRGLAKVEIALAKGKKDHDKRQDTKDRDWNREKSRLMRERG
jgi:SsrA-binding protein